MAKCFSICNQCPVRILPRGASRKMRIVQRRDVWLVAAPFILTFRTNKRASTSVVKKTASDIEKWLCGSIQINLRHHKLSWSEGKEDRWKGRGRGMFRALEGVVDAHVHGFRAKGSIGRQAVKPSVTVAPPSLSLT